MAYYYHHLICKANTVKSVHKYGTHSRNNQAENLWLQLPGLTVNKA